MNSPAVGNEIPKLMAETIAMQPNTKNGREKPPNWKRYPPIDGPIIMPIPNDNSTRACDENSIYYLMAL
jgi:hypothetical protein